MLSEFLSQGSATSRGGVDSIVDRDLSILMVQPSVDVLTALLKDLLTKNNRLRRGVREEVILGNDTALSNGGTTVITEVEDAGLDSQPEGTSVKALQASIFDSPAQVTRQGNADVTENVSSSFSKRVK